VCHVHLTCLCLAENSVHRLGLWIPVFIQDCIESSESPAVQIFLVWDQSNNVDVYEYGTAVCTHSIRQTDVESRTVEYLKELLRCKRSILLVEGSSDYEWMQDGQSSGQDVEATCTCLYICDITSIVHWTVLHELGFICAHFFIFCLFVWRIFDEDLIKSDSVTCSVWMAANTELRGGRRNSWWPSWKTVHYPGFPNFLKYYLV
jgi:hypothetical protein